MPHSSGGGSHGGGSHGGRGGSGGGARVSSKPFPGSHRYIYYRKRKPVIVYSENKLSMDGTAVVQLVASIYALAAAFVMMAAGIAGLISPKPVTTDYDTKIVIRDKADILTDEEKDEIEEAFEDFSDKTGITPAFCTVNNEDWKGDLSLERYSYKLYLKLFEDEKHWLIVYSEPEDPDPSFNDWHWEGMQGDDTDRVLTSKKADRFNDTFHSNLLKRDRFTVGEALADAFNRLTPEMLKKDRNSPVTSIIFLSLVIPFLAAATVLMVLCIRRTKDVKKSFMADEEVIRQIKCGYCGGVYIAGYHVNCPHCQAQIPAEYASQTVQ